MPYLKRVDRPNRLTPFIVPYAAVLGYARIRQSPYLKGTAE